MRCKYILGSCILFLGIEQSHAVGEAVQEIHARYRPDLDPVPADEIDRERLLRALRDFVAANRLQVEWPSVEQAPNDILINSLAMLCPFAPNEKQALLEAANLGERARVMTTLIEMALLNRGGAGDKPLH